MTSVFRAISLAIGQIGDPAFSRVMGIGVLGSLTVFVILWFLSAWVIGLVPWSDLPLIGWIFDWIGSIMAFLGEWITILGDVAFGAVMLVVTFLLFPAVTTAIVSIFLEDIVKAVEDKHYPNRPEARQQPMGEVIGQSVKFMGTVIGINILALPIYAILIFLPPLNLVFYYLLNGYLVGREFYEMVAVRRLSPEQVIVLRKKAGLSLVVAGAITVFCMTVPILNLLVPVLAAAAMVHIFEALHARQGQDLTPQ